jgi:polysaccharide deacetylase family protein (PEP-CTERM system associated)
MESIEFKLENPGRPKNIFSVDLEDYYMVSVFSRKIRFEDWDKYEGRIEKNTIRLLDLLDRYDVRGTFFVLGWVAKKYPELVRTIHSNGHEIASHGYNHKPVFDMTPEEFGRDLNLSRDILQDTIGERIYGYRAPSYSITRKSFWAIEVLIEEGFRFDSSIFPIRHDFYGYPEFERYPVTLRKEGSGQILEIPLSTIRIMGQNMPFGGGGYFRLYPLKITEWSINHLNIREHMPAIFYLHPWELDSEQPRVNVSRIRNLRHRLNIAKSEYRIMQLLKTFQFCSVQELFSV